jgi:hypothetical protein
LALKLKAPRWQEPSVVALSVIGEIKKPG